MPFDQTGDKEGKLLTLVRRITEGTEPLSTRRHQGKKALVPRLRREMIKKRAQRLLVSRLCDADGSGTAIA